MAVAGAGQVCLSFSNENRDISLTLLLPVQQNARVKTEANAEVPKSVVPGVSGQSL